MKIGIIGAGMIGGTLTELFTDAGHEVWVANTRGPATLRDLVEPLGAAAHAATIDEAAEAGELVVVAVPVAAYGTLPVAALAGKVVVDTGNHSPARDGAIAALDEGTLTSSEWLAAELPDSHVVKMFNTIYYVHLREHRSPAGTAGRRALPMAGDDAHAKSQVSTLVDQIGFDTVDLGPLAEGRRFQPGSPAYDVPLDVAALTAALRT